MSRYWPGKLGASLFSSSGTEGALESRDMSAQSSKKSTTGKKRAAPRLSRERRRALQVLANSKHLGVTEAIMMAYGFTTAMLAAMRCDGYVTVVIDIVRTGDRTTNVRRLQITDVGRKVLGDGPQH
jgi:hypothetical protein